jgi:hypothetical protein
MCSGKTGMLAAAGRRLLRKARGTIDGKLSAGQFLFHQNYFQDFNHYMTSR